jgi:hypothetical protein
MLVLQESMHVAWRSLRKRTVVEACTNEEGGGMVAEFYPPTSMAARRWSRGRRESEGKREGLSALPNGAAWLLGFPMHGTKRGARQGMATTHLGKRHLVS